MFVPRRALLGSSVPGSLLQAERWASAPGYGLSVPCRCVHACSLSGFQCDCSWFFFLFCVFLFTLVWLYIAIIILNDFHNFNE